VLSRLHTLTQQKTHTLTVYVDIDQNKQSNRKRGYLVQAEAMLKELRLQHGRSQRLDVAAERALDLIRSMRPSGKSALVVVIRHRPRRDSPGRAALAAAAYWHRGAFCGRSSRRWTRTSATVWC